MTPDLQTSYTILVPAAIATWTLYALVIWKGRHHDR